MALVRDVVRLAKNIQDEINEKIGPPEEGVLCETQCVIPLSIVRGTRGYIERVVNQVNGSYGRGWYDACSVMIRRLLETLIVEAYEHFNIASKIQNGNGDFVYLRDLIDACLKEKSWNLGRNCRSAMPKLKDIGDKSAHSRRYIAQKKDLEPLLADIRLVVQEFVYLAGLK
jgi:hypothetical protein